MKDNRVINLLFCGVGGQGILLCSDVVAYALMREGYDIKKSDVHGMAQRGGAVESYLRFGKKVYSPMVELADLDICVGLEMMEPLRYVHLYNKNTKVI
ncbi:MAG: indolepyruvate oxidoreductase subunit beta, partial [Nitrospirae bacterium]